MIVIYGAGAIGGTIGGRLAQAGHEVVLIARGAHAAALREHGLRMVSPDDDTTVRVAVVEHPRELAIGDADTVILAMKSQDTESALAALTGEPTIVCAQNGVANERAALRRFARVIAMCVMMPVTHETPGVVEIASAPITGLLDIGLYPSGSDAGVDALAATLASATFESIARTDIMRWKYKKLLLNLGNALEAATGRIQSPEAQAIADRARAEATAVFAAAG
ncbi:MAG: 2-dehydropantoate 2-reductase N-terminal domain-containing protein, partial [Kofleriaceae bacterium]